MQQRRFRRVAILVALVAGMVWLVRARLGGPPSPGTAVAVRWDLVPDVLVAVAASVSCALAAGRAGNRRARVAWISQSLASALWVLAPAAWLAGARQLDFLPNVGRAGFLALTAIGFWLTCRGPDRRARVRMLLDGGVSAAAIFVVAWAVVFASLWHPMPGAAAQATVAMAFPLTALVLIIFYGFLALTEFRRGKRRMPAWFAAGLALIAAADLRAAELSALDGGRLDGVDSAGWLLGFGCVVAAAHTYRGTTRRQSVPTTVGWLAYAPYLPLVAAAATVTVQALVTGSVPLPELAGVGVIVVLVLLRQVLMLAENRTLVARLAARERELAHQALHCSLTGLGNRLMLTTRLQAALDEPGLDGATALLFCDLDDFKNVNDTLGHDAGDELLIRVAERLRAALRPQDTVARLGGDEFAVLLTGCSPGEARAMADRVWQTFQAPFPVAGRSLSLGASVGLATVGDAGPEGAAASLLKAADIAMYETKRRGKNGVREFSTAAR